LTIKLLLFRNDRVLIIKEYDFNLVIRIE